MAIFDNDGTTNKEVAKAYDNDGVVNHEINNIYDNNGSVNSLIFTAVAPTVSLTVAPTIRCKNSLWVWSYSFGEYASFAEHNRLGIVFASDNWDNSDVVFARSLVGFYDYSGNPIYEQAGYGNNLAMGSAPYYVTRTYDISSYTGSYKIGFRITARGGGIINAGYMATATLYNI